MADIFISYSKADHEQVRLLAAFLEAEGYSVWWDSSLQSGENFRNVIMTELAQARAAIVVWTENSVRSDWVQSEAGRAQADRKLIPVKARGLEYRQIPPPFDVMHTENLDARDKILAAVVTQLAKPQVQAPALQLFSKRIRYETLGWIGAIGTALTLLNAIGPIMKLADWARYLIENWGRLMVASWNTVLAFLSINIGKEAAALLTANLCVIMMSIASRRGVASPTERDSANHGFLKLAPLVVLMCVIFVLAGGPTAGSTIVTRMIGVLFVSLFLLMLLAAGGRLVMRRRVLPVLGGVAIMVAVSPLAAIVVLMGLIGPALLLNPAILENVGPIQWPGWYGAAIIAAAVGLAFAILFAGPLVAVILADRRRLYIRIFRAFAIVALLALLNLLSVYAPAIRDLFNPS
jgi:TIR domain